jgi:hypothetical protein
MPPESGDAQVGIAIAEAEQAHTRAGGIPQAMAEFSEHNRRGSPPAGQYQCDTPWQTLRRTPGV